MSHKPFSADFRSFYADVLTVTLELIRFSGTGWSIHRGNESGAGSGAADGQVQERFGEEGPGGWEVVMED